MRHHSARTTRFLARIAGYERLVRRAPALWSYWRDSGRLELEHVDLTSSRVVAVDHPVMSAAGYALFYGAGSGTMAWLSGAREVRLKVEVPSPSRIVAHVHWAPHPPSGPGFHSIDEAVASLPEKL